jgi:hypothetical protein
MSEQPKSIVCANSGTTGGLREEISIYAYRGPVLAVPIIINNLLVGGYALSKDKGK